MRSIHLVHIMSLIMLTSCIKQYEYSGYENVRDLVSTVKVGDTKDSLSEKIGIPHVKSYDSSKWYYVSKKTSRVLFFKHSLDEQLMLCVDFDKQNKVSSKKLLVTNEEIPLSLNPSETPTRGAKQSYMDLLYDIDPEKSRVGF